MEDLAAAAPPTPGTPQRVPRSVVLAGAPRCPWCALPPRYCVCGLLPTVDARPAIHVLIHRHEQSKPSSTGRLVIRAVRGAACHVFRRPTPRAAGTGFPVDGPQPWILHPRGEPLPTDSLPPGGLLVLDGTWRQAGELLRSVAGRGRCVRLPDHATDEPSRYWLRDQAESSRISSAEALIAALRAMGDATAASGLLLHLELFVHAALLSRGKREMAERYLGGSPLPTAAPEALARLHARRA